MKEVIYARQGDVNLVKVANLPTEVEEIKPDNGKTVLAYGEVTGHSHALSATKTRQFKDVKTGKEYLQVTEKTKLFHEEHRNFDVEPGIYEKRIAREYQDQGMVRRVVD